MRFNFFPKALTALLILAAAPVVAKEDRNGCGARDRSERMGHSRSDRGGHHKNEGKEPHKSAWEWHEVWDPHHEHPMHISDFWEKW